MEKRPENPHASAAGHGERPREVLPQVDTSERGLPKDGVPQSMDRRLFMQLLVLRAPNALVCAEAIPALAAAFRDASVEVVVYEDVNDPSGLALLTYSEQPEHFVTQVRPVLAQPRFASLVARPEFSMFGRTYSTGYETDLPFWLIERPVQTVQHEGWDWAIFYPLRRKGEFNRLPKGEQGAILREHGTIGRAYGEQDLAHDIRLACHGLDTNDNDFVIGLIGSQLQPLSHVVQTMRGTVQTSQFMEKMGPFFIGRVARRVGGLG